MKNSNLINYSMNMCLKLAFYYNIPLLGSDKM